MTGYQEGDWPILTCTGAIIFIALCTMLQAVPSPSPLTASTPYPLHTPGSSPTALPTATPVRLDTPTPAEEGTLEVPLGIGIWDADNVDFFNRYARGQDVIAARLPLLDLLDDAEIGQKMLVVGGRDEPFTDMESIISEAKTIGVTVLGYNLETALPREELVSKEMQLQQVAGDSDLVYAFGPTLGKLERYYDDFARHADIIVLQSQRYQTRQQYEQMVEVLIERIRSANPDVKVWVQVSVNPPEKRDITPDEVIGHIQLIADKADLIWIFFASGRASAMEDVFKRLRQ